MTTNSDILQYESTIWATADLLRGCGIKESEWPSYMMPFFALMMVESRLLRMFDEIKEEFGGEEALKELPQAALIEVIQDKGQGYNAVLFQNGKALKRICQNDKSFLVDLDAYLHAFDNETRDLLGVDAVEGEKYLDIKGVISRLKAKKVLFDYTKVWSEIDLKPFNNSEITTLEEHIKRKWADISAETAGEQYTPDDVIALIAEIIASKIEPDGNLLQIYDCSCGGGNMLFGVEDRIQRKTNRATQTFGQDWNDALYALAKIESRFRKDSFIEHGNTLTDDKFRNREFDIVVANPPYGVSWKGYAKAVQNDKTGRFKYLPSISDGQLLFMQHLVAKLKNTGMGVVVHNGSTLFSGDAGSGESNIRKWLLDNDLVEAIIQLPTDEFFNTGIYTYLWVLNKAKAAARKNRVMLINASEKFRALKKNKGSKRKEVDRDNRQVIVETLCQFVDNDYARVFKREHFYFNKQAIMLTNLDDAGKSFEDHLPMVVNKLTGLKERTSSVKLKPSLLSNGERELTNFSITTFDASHYRTLYDYFYRGLKPFIASLDYREQPLRVETKEASYHFDAGRETLVKTANGVEELLGCGKIIVKTAFKDKTAKQAERIEITVELTPDYQKDYEIIPFERDAELNALNIEAFLKIYVTKPFTRLDNVIGVEINFNKVFYQPETLRPVHEIMADIAAINDELHALEKELVL
ncbi:MAG: N-6 DNA methylase [Candidatus Thiothrix moscowensis]|nr:N-6 DNA methylase [Candidatus Thiothrix moscowensis]